jgi:BirA family biotin operon repressor/biotin-[acetyl-CoA-carboxylase] ligase
MARLLTEELPREGTVVIAERQTKGRGRLNREWVSPPEGLWFSIILRPRVQARHLPKLTLLASVAVAKTLRRLYGLKAEITWPNDVLVNGRKVCGILTEAETKGESTEFAVVGIGINVNFDLSALPKSLENSSTTLKHELKREIQREVLLASLLEEMESLYELFSKERFDQLLDEWRNLAGMLGSSVEIRVDGEKVQGQAVNICQNGALILRLKNGVIRTIAFGDLKVLNTAVSK